MFNEAKCVRPMFGGYKLKKNVPSDFFSRREFSRMPYREYEDPFLEGAVKNL